MNSLLSFLGALTPVSALIVATVATLAAAGIIEYRQSIKRLPVAAFLIIKRLPVVAFLIRYWLLLVAFAPLAYLYTTNDQEAWLFKTFGPGLYPPGLCFLTVVLFLLARHLWFHETADRDAGSGQYVQDWRAVEPHVRVYATVALTIGILFSFAYIVGSTGK